MAISRGIAHQCTLETVFKLDVIIDDQERKPILRLWGGDAADLKRLQALLMQMARPNALAISLESVADGGSDGMSVTLCRSRDERGLRVTGGGVRWAIVASAEGFLEMADKVRPLVENPLGFQLLCDDGDAIVLLSPSGGW